MSKSSKEEYRHLASWVGNICGIVFALAGMYGLVVLLKRGDGAPLTEVIMGLVVFNLGAVFGRFATLGGLMGDDKKGTDNAKG